MAAVSETEEYRLYKLSRVVALGDEHGGGDRILTRLTAGGSGRMHSMVALACSNLSSSQWKDKLVLRYHDAAGTSIVRFLDWFSDESRRRPEAICFDRFAVWLLCVGHEGSMHLIPQLALLAPDKYENVMSKLEHQRFGGRNVPVDRVSSTAPIKQLAGKVTCCAWWTAYDGTDIALVGTKTGEVTFWTLPDASLLRVVSFGSSVDRMEIAEDVADSVQMLLVSAGGHIRLVLEEDTADTASQSLSSLFQPARAEYEPTHLKNFERQDDLQVQSIRGMTVVSAHDRYKTHRLQVLSFGLDPNPLYVHQLSDGMAHVLLTDDLVFCGSGGRTGRIVVASNLLSRTSLNNDDPESMSRLASRSTVQTLNLPEGERILAVYPHTKQKGEKCNALMTCTVVTSTSMFDLRQDVLPDELFVNLLVAGKSPEDLAMTLKLDAAALYQEGIRTLIELGDETAARVLPLICSEETKSQIEHNDVVPLLAETGQVALLTSYLRSYLDNPAALRTTARKQLSDILLIAYTQQLLVRRTPRDGVAAHADSAVPDEETAVLALDNFLRTNSDYSTKLATRLLLDASALDLLLGMAKVRGDVHEVLSLAVSERVLKFPPTAIDKVLARGLGDEICSFEGGLLLQYLPSSDVIKLLLGAAVPDLYRCYRHAGSRLTALDRTALDAIAVAFQPGAPGTENILQEQSVLQTSGDWTTATYVEFYLQVLLELRKRDRDDETRSKSLWHVTGVEMLRVTAVNVSAPASSKSGASVGTRRASPTDSRQEPSTRALQKDTPTYLSKHGHVRSMSECSTDSVGSLTTLVPSSRSISEHTQSSLAADRDGDSDQTEVPMKHAGRSTFQTSSISVQRFSGVIPTAFTELYGMYNVHSMVQHSLTLRDYDSAAHLYALSNRLDEAFVMRLRALQNTPVSEGTSSEDLAALLSAELTAILGVYSARREIPEEAEQVKSAVYNVLAPFLGFWSSRSLPASNLEDVLRDYLPTIALPVMDLMHAATKSPALEAELQGVLVRLSAEFYTLLRRAVVEAEQTEASRGKTSAVTSVDVSDSQLWAEIAQNLDKGVSTRLFATVNPNTSGRRGDGDDVVFTCGHTFAKRVFSESVLPELRQRTMKLPTPLPETARLLCQEYAKRFICLSCPLCVFNVLRREQGAEPWLDVYSYERGYE